MGTLAAWDGRPLGELIVVAQDRLETGGSLLAAASVVDNTAATAVTLGPEQVADFIKLHQQAKWVCYRAANFHWELHQSLAAANDQSGLASLWNLSRHCRWHDVMLLHQRRRAAWYGVFPCPRTLEALSQEYCASLTTLGSPEAAVSHYERLERSLHAIRHVYQAMLPQVQRIIDSLGQPDQTEAYGPLGVGLDAQAAIAVMAIQRHGIHISKSIAEELTSELEQGFQNACRELARYKQLRGCFRWDSQSGSAAAPSLIRREKGGFLDCDNNRLRTWLGSHVATLCDGHDGRVLPPLGDELRPSVDMRHWGVHARLDSGLKAISDANSFAAGLRALREHKLELSYEVIPGLQTRGAAANDLRHTGRAVFEPSPGHVFLIGQMQDLELRCFTWLCQTRYLEGDCDFYIKLGQGDDLVELSAARLFRHVQPKSLQPGTNISFEGLKEENPDQYQQWLKFARVLWKGLLLGVGDEQLAKFLQSEGLELLPQESRQLREIMIHEVCSELKIFLWDQSIAHAAERIGANPDTLFSECILAEHPETSAKAFRNVLAGAMPGGPIWQVLEKNATQNWQGFLTTHADGSREAYDLLSQWPTAVSGAVGGRVYSTQLRPAECQQLADEVMKVVTFEIVANGFQLVAIQDHEFVVEIEETQSLAAANLQLPAVIQVAVSKFLADAAKQCVSFRVQSSW